MRHWSLESGTLDLGDLGRRTAKSRADGPDHDFRNRSWYGYLSENENIKVSNNGFGNNVPSGPSHGFESLMNDGSWIKGQTGRSVRTVRGTAGPDHQVARSSLRQR